VFSVSRYDDGAKLIGIGHDNWIRSLRWRPLADKVDLMTFGLKEVANDVLNVSIEQKPHRLGEP
jgi:hypothetical protein